MAALQHMEFPGQGSDLSHSFDLCHSSGKAGFLNPLCRAGDRTCVPGTAETLLILLCLSGTPQELVVIISFVYDRRIFHQHWDITASGFFSPSYNLKKERRQEDKEEGRPKQGRRKEGRKRGWERKKVHGRKIWKIIP